MIIWVYNCIHSAHMILDSIRESPLGCCLPMSLPPFQIRRIQFYLTGIWGEEQGTKLWSTLQITNAVQMIYNGNKVICCLVWSHISKWIWNWNTAWALISALTKKRYYDIKKIRKLEDPFAFCHTSTESFLYIWTHTLTWLKFEWPNVNEILHICKTVSFTQQLKVQDSCFLWHRLP